MILERMAHLAPHRPTIILAAVMILLSGCVREHEVKICAHRGFWQCEDVPNAQNSLASLRMAQEYNFWGSEFDVHLTADDVAVVHHDGVKDGLPIHTSTYAQLSEKPLKNGEVLPTLEMYLDQGKESDCVLVIELKPEDSREQGDRLVDLCFAALKERDLWNPERVMFISFDLEICKKVAALAPEFTNQYLEGDLTPAELHKMGINGIDYEDVVFQEHPEWIEEAQKLGMSTNAWTVNTEEGMEYLIGLGIDCITTNKPLLLREILK